MFNFLKSKLLGRESVPDTDDKDYDFAKELVLAFGGKTNILGLDACITRLRIEVKDISRASQERLKELGASGIFLFGNNLQAIFGPRSASLKSDMEEYLKITGAGTGLGANPVSNVRAISCASAELGSDTAGIDSDFNVRATASEAEILVKARHLIAALGGSDNLMQVSAFALTRIRLRLRNENIVSVAEVQAAGAQSVARIGNGIWHIIVGLNAEVYVAQIKRELEKTH